MSITSTDEYHLFSVLPPNADIRLEDYRPVVQAAEEAQYLASDRKSQAIAATAGPQAMHGDLPSVSLEHDDDLPGAPLCVQVLCQAATLRFPVKCALPLLTIQLKDLDRWATVTISVAGQDGVERVFEYSNKYTLAKIHSKRCTLPMLLTAGWNLLSIDIPAIMHHAYGVLPEYTAHIEISGTCRVLRVYFQDRQYADSELPPFLRTLKD